MHSDAAGRIPALEITNNIERCGDALSSATKTKKQTTTAHTKKDEIYTKITALRYAIMRN